MKGAITTILMGIVLIQLGCAASSGQPRYPSEWASIKSAPIYDNCPNLQGTYSNQGSATYPSEAGASPSLSEVFTQLALEAGLNSPADLEKSWPVIPNDISVVSIDQTSETLTVTFVDSEGKRTPLNFRRYRLKLSEDRIDDLFGCRLMYGEPILRFFAEPRRYFDGTVVYMVGGGTFVVLLKAVDGSLVVNWRSDSVAMTLFVLGSGYRVNNLWYRYPLIEAEKLSHNSRLLRRKTASY
jgi:hypothetical protein